MNTFKKIEQDNAADINLLLMSEYCRELHIDEITGEVIWGTNTFLEKFLSDFTHIDTRGKANGDMRLQGWYKPSVTCALPECEVWGFDPEMGIFIGAMTIKRP